MLIDPDAARRRFGLSAELFPFDSRFIEVGGARLHHIDEGSGPVLLMLHGNPAWCLLYRHVIAALRPHCRCIAIDLPGFGLSEPPPDFGHTPAEHAGIIGAALTALDLRDATLIAHDWGGPIGLRAMLDTGRISGVVLGNTWAWPVNGNLHFEWFSRLMGGALGRWGARRFALFVNSVLPMSMKRGRLKADVMAAYRAPFVFPRSRDPLYLFPRNILASRVWLAKLWEDLQGWHGPAGLIWPENDIAFRARELARWQSLWPGAPTRTIPRCGHFLWEDAPAESSAALLDLIDTLGIAPTCQPRHIPPHPMNA
jgi:haloalkane dehalogenase